MDYHLGMKHTSLWRLFKDIKMFSVEREEKWAGNITMYSLFSTTLKYVYMWVCVVYVCLNTHIKVLNYIKEIHWTVNRESWIVDFNSLFYISQYVSVF